MIEIAVMDKNIRHRCLGSTTWKRSDLAKGLEGDECYYIQHEQQVRGRDDLDLRRDPPPDLVVEVDITHHAMERLGIYAAMGVPEVWRFDGEKIEFLALEGGEYRAVPR